MKPKDILAILKTATRIGSDEDEPEGTRYIILSDTLTNEMVICIESLFISFPSAEG